MGRRIGRRGGAARRDPRCDGHGRWGASLLPVVAIAMVVGASARVEAQTAWVGTESTDWFDADNWSAGLPSASVDALINTSSVNTTGIGSGVAAARALTVGQNGGLASLAIFGGAQVGRSV